MSMYTIYRCLVDGTSPFMSGSKESARHGMGGRTVCFHSTVNAYVYQGGICWVAYDEC